MISKSCDAAVNTSESGHYPLYPLYTYSTIRLITTISVPDDNSQALLICSVRPSTECHRDKQAFYWWFNSSRLESVLWSVSPSEHTLQHCIVICKLVNSANIDSSRNRIVDPITAYNDAFISSVWKVGYFRYLEIFSNHHHVRRFALHTSHLNSGCGAASHIHVFSPL